MEAVQQLRAATAADHDSVDAAFGGFDLADRADYGRFLTAHGRALPAVEAALRGAAGLPELRPRAPLIARDLAALGLAMPTPLPFSLAPSLATQFGAAYVIEGSRLGGGVLVRQVDPALPRAYLSATHLAGEWRAFLAGLERAAEGPHWIAAAIMAASATFALYRAAASA